MFLKTNSLTFAVKYIGIFILKEVSESARTRCMYVYSYTKIRNLHVNFIHKI
jgi:hypothetical protein